MNKKFIAGGCSFTFGHELSDDLEGKIPSKKSWHKKDSYTAMLLSTSSLVGGFGSNKAKNPAEGDDKP